MFPAEHRVTTKTLNRAAAKNVLVGYITLQNDDNTTFQFDNTALQTYNFKKLKLKKF